MAPEQCEWCNGNLASGKICSQTTLKDTLLDGTTYTWTFNVDATGAMPQLPDDGFHLQAAWFYPEIKKGETISKKAGAISQGFETSTGSDTIGSATGSEVPEPASLLLLGSGLAGPAMRLRRNRK